MDKSGFDNLSFDTVWKKLKQGERKVILFYIYLEQTQLKNKNWLHI